MDSMPKSLVRREQAAIFDVIKDEGSRIVCKAEDHGQHAARCAPEKRQRSHKVTPRCAPFRVEQPQEDKRNEWCIKGAHGRTGSQSHSADEVPFGPLRM